MTSEQAYETEVYYMIRSVFEAGHHGSRDGAESDTFRREDR